MNPPNQSVEANRRAAAPLTLDIGSDRPSALHCTFRRGYSPSP